jgi:hypothetical protein
VAVSSAAAGDVVKIADDDDNGGKRIEIVAAAQPAFTLVYFHVVPANGVEVGAKVSAGQKLGNVSGGDAVLDVAIRVSTIGGFRYVSVFDAFSDAPGAPSRGAFIISAEERDAHPLACDGERFLNPAQGGFCEQELSGGLENKVLLR